MLRAMSVPSTDNAHAMHVHEHEQTAQTAIDPVCGMTVSTADARYRSSLEGTTYYFCSAGCKETFDKDPARFLKPA